MSKFRRSFATIFAASLSTSATRTGRTGFGKGLLNSLG
jgi:hypothetical protein